MVVADAVLVDVIHGEAAGLSVVLAVDGALDGAMPRSLDDGEGDGLRLEEGRVRDDAGRGVDGSMNVLQQLRDQSQ